jgi:hypothetical protein
MKIKSDSEEWKSDNENNETGNIMKIKSEESKAEIKITFHRPRQRQKNGSPINLRKFLKLKHSVK